MLYSNSKRLIGIEEADEYLGIKVVSLRNLLRNEKGILAYKIGQMWDFNPSELDEWVKSGKRAL